MLSYDSFRCTEWAIGILGLEFPLCSRTAFKLRSEESMKRRHYEFKSYRPISIADIGQCTVLRNFQSFKVNSHKQWSVEHYITNYINWESKIFIILWVVIIICPTLVVETSRRSSFLSSRKWKIITIRITKSIRDTEKLKIDLNSARKILQETHKIIPDEK